MNEFNDSNAESAKEIFFAALDQPNVDARSAFLDGACGKNPLLRQRVDKLLADHFEEDAFLQTAAVDGPPTLTDTTPVTEGPGAQIDRYKLLQKLGEGGFGVVYMAEQKEPVKRRVALKIIKLGMDTKQVVARFEAERQALAMMEHPNIAKVLDAGATDTGRPYFVMELVKGVPITKYCDDNNLTTHERLDLFIPVCQAIQHAHQKGIIHRDIKPSNVMVTLHDGAPVPKVIDFGIAKATQQELTEKTLFTHYSQFIGTPAYMSPEQAEMSGLDVDTRSDIYSLGVLLYELLVGRTPLDSKELMSGGYDEIRRRIREEEPPKPSTRVNTMEGPEKTTVAKHRMIGPDQLSSELRGDLDWIVLKALEKNRTRRYETANGFVLDIKRFLNDEPVTAVAPSNGYLLKKYVRRHKASLAVAATIAGLLIIGIATSSLLAIRATRAQREAEDARARESNEKREAQNQRQLAQEMRQEAEAASQRELALRQEAEESERKQRLSAYAADMSLAHRYLNENNLTAVDEILNRYATKEGERVRGIYWTHLNDVSKGDEMHTFPHETMVRSISLSADGTLLASHTLSGRVRLYDVSSMNLLWEHGGGLLSYGAQESSVALSPDGRLLAADQQGILKVWNAVSEELVFEEAHVVAPIEFSPDSQFLVGVSETGLHLWNISDWSKMELPIQRSDVDTSQAPALTFTPDGNRLVFSPSPFASRLIIYNLASETIEGELTGLDRPSVLSTDGSIMAAGGWGGQLAVWDLASRALIKSFKAHNSIVLGVALSPDGKTLATGGNDSVINLWDTDTFKVNRVLRGHHSQIWNLKFSVDGRYLASAGMDQSVKLWEAKALKRAVQDSTAAGAKEQPLDAQDYTEQNREHVAKSAQQLGPSTTHVVRPGENIQAAINAAQPGDRVDLAAGVHPITEMIVITKPLILRGEESKENAGAKQTVLQGIEGLRTMMRIETGSANATLIRDLRIEAHANGVQHMSGTFSLQSCYVTIRSPHDFNAVLSLDAMGHTDTVNVDTCTLLAEYVGDTIEGTPPDVDVILANSGTRYAKITVTGCKIENQVPNAISNGIETRSTTAHVNISNNHIHCQGMGVILPNHVGAVVIRNNTIWSTVKGIGTGSDSQEHSYIIGNRITIDAQGLEVYPLFLRNYIARPRPRCIALGQTSAGVTAGFFLKEVIGLAANFHVEANTLSGNPKYGIALTDSPDPEKYGPFTPNQAHHNIITRNDFSNLEADRDVVLGASTFENLIFGNLGLESIYKAAGERDRNHVSLSRESPARYVADEITSPSLEGNLLGDSATRSMWVWLPPGYESSTEERYPTIYLLHGFTGNHNQFKHGPMLNLNVGEMASHLIEQGRAEEVIIVMPDASNVYGGSFYTSNEVIGDYRTYIAHDLVDYIDAKYRTIPHRNSRSIAGNSMGANGAISLAMAYPETFGAVAAMSPSADYAATPTRLDGFIEANPTSLGEPTLVHNTEELRSLLSGNVWVNLLYAEAAAFSPNPAKPPYYVDLPLRYPAKTTVAEVWTRWLDQDLASEIERDGQNLKHTDILIDIGVGPTTIMAEGHDIQDLRDALDKEGVVYTFVESPGDHLSHLRLRTIEVIKFLSSAASRPVQQVDSGG